MTTILDIGADLVRARRSCGLSQRKLGERLGVRQQQVARWEASAYRTASLERIDAVARALDYELPQPLPLAAEAPAAYDTTSTIAPVRDLGEVVARIRANGDEFRDRFHIDRIAVFGSFAHGEQTPESDVDLLVEFTERPRGFAYFEPIDFFESILGRKVDMVEEHVLRDRLRSRVRRDAIHVWSAR